MKTSPTNSIKVFISLGLLYLIWSSTFLSVRVLLDYLPPLFITFSRNIVAGSLLLIWSILGKHWRKMSAKDLKVHLFAGVMLIFFGNGFMSLAGSIMPSGFSSVFMALGPLLLVLFFWTVGKKPSTKKLIGTILGMVGIIILVSQKSLAIPGQELSFWKGIAFLSVAVVCWNLGVFSIQHLKANTYHFTQVCSIQMITGACIAFFVSFFIEDHSTIIFSDLPIKAYLVFFYLALIGSMLGFSIFGYLSKVCDATLVATYTYVNPILALILGNIILDETFHQILLLASFFILLAVVLITTDKNKQSNQ
jgi:drug/metabolite transporter (DMT)-like permease